MFNLNVNSINPNIYAQKVPFKGADNTAVSNPIDPVKKLEQQRELASKECAYATRATAMAQVLTGNNLKFTTTSEEYAASLTKQGKIPDKDFKVVKLKEVENDNLTYIEEFNSNGEKLKRTTFCRYNKCSGSWNEQCFYNPKYDKEYKSVTYKQDGGIIVSNYDVTKQASVDDYYYRSDGSLEYYKNFDTMQAKHISKDGKVTKYSMLDEKGNFIRPEYDDNGNLISADR